MKRQRSGSGISRFMVLFFVLAVLPPPTFCQSQGNVRKAVVSGQFYPASPEVLANQIQDALRTSDVSPDPKIQGLIVPHAGYPFSGKIAADAYKAILGQHFDSVIIIGFPHRVSLPGIFIDDADFYETPLGKVPVDKVLADQIRNYDSALQDRPKVTMEEHSIEVQIPFLQEALPDLKIVPVYMGGQTLKNAEILSKAIAQAIKGRDVLVVASSDLSHYHPDDKARQKDDLLISLLEGADFIKLVTASDQRKIEACGFGPIMSLMLLREKMGWEKPVLIRYANSGDVTGDRRAVVGYTAMAFRKGKEVSPAVPLSVESQSEEAIPPVSAVVPGSTELTADDKTKLLRYIRDYLKTYFDGSSKELVFDVKSPILDEHRGVFITLKKYGMLRGCVGQIVSEEPVSSNLKKMTIAAALHDGRFKPVSADEINDLEFHISILTEPKPVGSYKDIRLGTDGIIVGLGPKAGVFLPEVATETQWDQETFFKRCATEKAGLKGSEIDRAKIYVFQSISFGEEKPIQ